ncbi:MAG: thioredoxin domain-containing protein [Desulfovibrionaceae bacterium]|nr:thioredoxin domain-containing protein [Desulfovibrionaceae bacterium]
MRIFLFLVSFLCIHIAHTAYAKPLTEESVRQFLKENPTIILDVLREHSVELLRIVVEGSEKEAQQELENQLHELKANLEKERTKKRYPTIVANRPFIGSTNAPITLVAYSDFLCPYCANSAQTISQLLSQSKNVQYIFKAYTRNPLGQVAYAFFLTLWTKDKEKAFQFYTTLFSNQERLLKEKKAYLLEVVKELGYNPEQIESLAESSAIQDIIKEDIAEGNALKIKGTPTLMVNGKYSIIGAAQLEILQFVIDYAQKNP